MKATSKIISVVLILAICLSLFTVSAFADNTTIVAPMERSNNSGSGKVVEYNYRGEGYGQPEPGQEADQGEVKEDAQSKAEEPAQKDEVVVNDASVAVATVAELQKALEEKAANISLTAQIDWDGVLNLDYDVKIDLGGKGNGLAFSGSGDAAIVSSADAVLFNGNIFVNGDVAATDEAEAVSGFKTVAAAVEEGSVYLNGVYVKYIDAGENAIFGEGVSLGSSVFSQDVSAYYGKDAASQYDFSETESGMFDVTAKAPVVEETQPAEPADEENENNGEAAITEAGPLVGTCVTDEGTITVTVSGQNLPEGLTVKVAPMDKSTLQVSEDEEVLFVVDITLLDKDGNVYEPENDPNVPEVSVQIRHPALGNVEDGEAVTLYHIVKGEAVEMDAAQGGDALEFSTDSFSPYGVTTKKTGSDGNVHYREVRIIYADGDIYYNDPSGSLKIDFTGKKMPESVSIVPYNVAGSGDYYVYTAGLLDYDSGSGGDYTATDSSITIKADALKYAPDGKYGIVFWFTDTDDEGNTVRVYMVQPLIIVNSKKVEGTGDNFTPDGLDFSKGTFDVEMCDNDSVKIKLTSELKSFSISGNGSTVSYSAPDKKITIDGKQYNAYEYFSVEEYETNDPAGHDFIAGKVLTLHSALIKKLDFKDGYTLKVEQENGEKGEFTLNIAPGITVADGLDDYIKGKNLWVKFQACAPIDYDEDGTLAIWIGGQKISHDYYSISNDHKTLWIYRNLLDQLKSNNRYTLKARLWRNVKDPGTGKTVKETYYPATASFNVLAAGSTSSKSPKTGDESNVALWASVLVLSGGAVIALVPKKKSRAR